MRQCLSALLLADIASSAGAWEYQIVVKGAIIYQESNPPANISYPSPGHDRAAEVPTDQALGGRVISEAELRQNLNRPHLVIIPDQTTEPRQAPR